MTTDWNAFLQDCVNESRANTRPTRPTKPTDTTPAPERYEAGMTAEPFERETWPVYPPIRKVKRHGRVFHIPLPTIRNTLVIPFVAGALWLAFLLIFFGAGWRW